MAGSGSGVKSAYERALERLDTEGIARPDRDALSEPTRERMAEVRSRAEARLAELEILHRKGAADRGSEDRERAEKEYQAERRRIEERRDRELEKLRRGGRDAQ